MEKLQEGLLRMAEASKKTKEPEQAVEVPTANMFLNAKHLLKPVNRGESLNTPEKQRLPTVKRAESDNIKRLEPFDKRGDRKVSKGSTMTNNFESDEDRPEKQGISLSPMFPRKDASANKTTLPVPNVKPTRPLPSETPNKRAGIPKPGTSETSAPPVPRASPFRNPKEEANSKGLYLTPLTSRLLPACLPNCLPARLPACPTACLLPVWLPAFCLTACLLHV